ncbi:MAG: hypothetical protein IKV00_09140, partial [Clostridia bacterium]|nr:hypothetical protein [Clostridia bacterium]
MRQGKISTRALSALLALLMVLSVVIALPAVAEETVTESASTVKELYSLDFSKAGGAKDKTQTKEWLLANNGFATTNDTNNVIDANGFYKIAQSNRVISNGAPSDFINLLAGWYNGYNTPGKTYEISMDLRIDSAAAYTRTTSSPIKDKESGETVGYNYYYEDAAGNKYSSIYTDESGWSFFAARLGDTYNSLFRIGMVDGKTYLFAESSALSVNSTNIKEVGNVYVKDADGKKLYVSDIGGQVTGNTGSFGLAYIIVPEKSYEIENGGVYSLRVVYELTKRTGTKTSVKAHLYVKGANDAEETYLGNTTWASNTTLAANGFRISDAGGIASIANIKVTVDEPSTVVWSADLSKFGPNADGNMAKGEMASHLANTLAIKGQTAALTTPGNSAQVIGGFVNAGGNSTSLATTDAHNPFIDLLTGNFVHKGETLTSTFIEFDYKLGNSFSYTSRSSSATVDGKTVTIYTDYAANGGGTYFLRFRSGGNNGSQLFRVAPNGYLFTGDLEATTKNTDTGVDGYLYYKDGNDTIYFDANGYRYKLVNGEKDYIDTLSAARPVVSGLNIGGCAGASNLDRAYKLTKGTTYRIGVKNVVESVSGGISIIKQTVYIKAPGDTEWTLVGTSTQKWYAEGATGYDEPYQIIWMAGANHMMFGGNMTASICTNGQHAEGAVAHESILSDTGITYVHNHCLLCGETLSYTKDGVAYTSETVTTEGCVSESYTLWTAADGSGKTFITNVTTTGSHSYATGTGLCSKCNSYVYMPNNTRRSNTSLAIATGLDNKPTYDSATQTIKAPNGGMALCYPVNDLNPRSPFIMTLEFKITEAIVNNTSKSNSWPLLSYQVGNGSTSVLAEYVCVDLVDGQLTLMLGTYRNRPLKAIEYDTWYTLQVAVVPDSDETIKYDEKGNAKNSTSDARIYLDGEMLGEKWDFSFVYGAAQSGNVRVGIQTAVSYYRFGWEARYVDLYQTTLEGAYTEMGTNEIINIRYDRYQTGSPSHSNTRPNIGTTLSSFRETEIVGGKYGILEGSAYKTVSLSTLLASGEEFGVSGKKYEIGVKFAVPDTDSNGDGHADALIEGGQNLIRLSKYSDDIESRLLRYRSWGQIYAPSTTGGENMDLYFSSGEQVNVLRKFDENGVPTSVLDLRVVVDEANNTYSVYADGKVVYYWTGGAVRNGQFLPFVDMPMPLTSDGGTDKTTYGSITKADAEAAGVTGTYQYVRFFREMSMVALEEISVRLIPDSDLELVGTQVKSGDFKETSGKFDLRFVFALDDIYVNAVKFEIKAYDNGKYMGVQYASIQTVLEGIIEDHETSYACKYGEGDYLAAVCVRDIPETNSTNVYTFEITAYTTINGTDPISIAHYTVSCNGVGG